MSELTIGSLFSGVGGLDLGVMEALGGTVAWHAEFEEAPSRILAHHWPDVPNLGDVTRVDWSQVEPVDVICGGSPCQDVSMAGARKGMRAGTRSGLWASMCDAIETIRPALVVWENVRGALSAGADSNVEPCPICVGDGPATHLRALGRVLGDLAELGYDAGWEVVRASDVGAPHRRERVFVVAWPADADRAGPQGPHDPARTSPARLGGHALAGAGGSDVTLLPTPTTSDTNGTGAHGDGGADLRTAVQLLPTPSVADAMGGHERRGGARGDELLLKGMAKYGHLDRFGQYAPAIARWEAVLGRTAPAPTETKPPPPAPQLNRHGNPRANPTHRLSARFVEWMMGLPEGHVVDVPSITRNQALRALGNGVVPQQAAHAIRRILAGIVVAKRRGTTAPGEQWVVMTLADLVSILTGSREGVPF